MKHVKKLLMMLFLGVFVFASVRSPVIAVAKETVVESETQSVTDTEPEASEAVKQEGTLVRRIASENGIQTYALGTYGVNHGMYRLYSSVQIISELGSNSSDPYSHIIQLDTNGDGDYSDLTYTAYCIQYGVLSPGGNYLTESSLSVLQKKYIGYALAYGWRQTGTAYDESQYSNLTNKSEYTVTQGIIWCCSKGIFNTASGESAMTKIINASCDPTHARTYYTNLKSTILNAETKPSFDGQTLTLEWSDANNRYEKTVTDTNGILSNYTYTYSGINFSKSGNTLTVYTTNTYPSAVTASASRTIYGGENSVVCWDGWSSTQDMATYTSYSQTLTSTINIQTKARNGYAKIKKSSSNPEVTNGNACYSLAGAVYGVYTDAALQNNLGTLTTDANGDTTTFELLAGTYYVRELTAPTGYYLDSKTYKITVTAGQTTTLQVSDKPEYDPVYVLLRKYDSSTGTATAQGDGSLAKAEFTIKYYSGLWDKNVDPASLGKNAERSWTFATDTTGYIKFRDAYKVAGDDFYYSETGNPFIPRGTITIQETKAPDGYHINDTVYVFQMLPGTNAGVSTWNIKEIPETVSKVTLYKKETGTDAAIPGTKFLHTFPDGTTEVLITDANGMLEVLGLAQGTHTLQELAAVDGYVLDDTIIEFTVDSQNNVSFKTPFSGSIHVAVDSDKNGVITMYNDLTGYQLAVHKSNNEDVLLDGAEFTLFADADLSQVIETAVTVNGTLRFSDLTPGTTYYLAETKAPDGYRLPVNTDGSLVSYELVAVSSPVSGSFNFNFGGAAYTVSDTNDTQDVYLSGDAAEWTIHVKVINEIQMKLPETGSPIMIPMLLLGCSCIMAALGLSTKRRFIK